MRIDIERSLILAHVLPPLVRSVRVMDDVMFADRVNGAPVPLSAIIARDDAAQNLLNVMAQVQAQHSAWCSKCAKTNAFWTIIGSRGTDAYIRIDCPKCDTHSFDVIGYINLISYSPESWD